MRLLMKYNLLGKYSTHRLLLWSVRRDNYVIVIFLLGFDMSSYRVMLGFEKCADKAIGSLIRSKYRYKRCFVLALGM